MKVFLLISAVCYAACHPKGSKDCNSYPSYHNLCRFHQGIAGAHCYRNGKPYRWNQPLTSVEKATILDVHNKKRSLVALGKTTLPSAANMLSVVYDDELAKIAQRWADQCFFDHDCHRSSECRNTHRDSWVGQNILSYSYSNGKENKFTQVLATLMDNWYDEIIFTSEEMMRSFPKEHSADIGHFTQMIWADTSRVGCGISIFDGESDIHWGRFLNFTTVLLVCNYAPGGNLIRDSVYEFGNPASNCPCGTHPCDATGLCDPDD